MLPTELLAQADCPPTHFYVPEGARFTLAEEVADLMESVGYQVDAEERLACAALYPQQANGNWTGLDSGIVAPRQNIKTVSGIGGALHDTFVQGEDVIWTAHEFKTSAKTLREFDAVISGTPWLAAEVLGFRSGTQDPGFNLRNGARLDLLARTGRSGRGMGGPRVYLDEGLYLADEMMGALVPTMSAMPNAHMVVLSSPGLLKSKVLRSFRRRGRSLLDPYLGWIEWSQVRGVCELGDECRHEPGTPGCWLDDLASTLRVNPAHPRRISLEFIQQERLTLAGVPGEYLRERKGVWEDPLSDDDVDRPVTPSLWADLADAAATLPATAPRAFAVDTSWDRQVTWAAVAGLLPDGRVFAELARSGFGQEWAPAWLSERAVDPVLAIGWQANGAPVSSLTETLKHDLPEDLARPLTGVEVAAASGMIHDLVEAGQIVHIGQDHAKASIAGALWRYLGDARTIDRKASESDASPLVALAEAIYLVKTTPVPQPRYVPRRIR